MEVLWVGDEATRSEQAGEGVRRGRGDEPDHGLPGDGGRGDPVEPDAEGLVADQDGDEQIGAAAGGDGREAGDLAGEVALRRGGRHEAAKAGRERRLPRMT